MPKSNSKTECSRDRRHGGDHTSRDMIRETSWQLYPPPHDTPQKRANAAAQVFGSGRLILSALSPLSCFDNGRAKTASRQGGWACSALRVFRRLAYARDLKRAADRAP
jgi:hypothetical protein